MTYTWVCVSFSSQENDFGGWPENESDLPVANMSEDHKLLLVAKCSRRAKIQMPKFGTASSRCTTPGFAGPTGASVTPAPELAGMSHDVIVAPCFTTGQYSSVTPNANEMKKGPAAGKKPSAQAIALHRKWQEAAEQMGGPEARIIVSKSAAKPLVFDCLHDNFQPMNITQIYKVRI
jgi:hypothetical protein